MKTLMILMIAVTGLTLTSCNRCQECECPLGVNDKICRDDYDSKDDFQDAVDDAEDLGCDCDYID